VGDNCRGRTMEGRRPERGAKRRSAEGVGSVEGICSPSPVLWSGKIFEILRAKTCNVVYFSVSYAF